jgi:crotonobetainyl-CoA:carnitine CoA-transferase CaiB-like acyl-CoA transferase
MKPPFNLDGFEPRMDAIPALGAQSGAILSELGFAAGEIQRMEASGIIQLGGKP